ncbi:MAG: 5-aminolevulic acid synthase [Pseudorhodobacter sp.]|nr:5-aminolevulic acid synthase [Pseudorhodobacter sp.]
MRLAGLVMAVVGIGTVAAADPITGKAARALLFAPEGAEVELLLPDLLPEAEARALKLVAEAQPYYGAVAISPDEGLMAEATVAAANYHDTNAATLAALAECDAMRKSAAPCVVVALIRPKGWEPRGLQLSAAATAVFATDYKGKRGKALAISTTTGRWGIATGDGAAAAAVAACAAKATPPADDCAVVVAD